MTDTTHSAGIAGALRMPQPQPVTNYRTSDGKTHSTEIDAIAHETFLAVKGNLPLKNRIGDKDAAVVYDTITTLARQYQFIKRSAE